MLYCNFDMLKDAEWSLHCPELHGVHQHHIAFICLTGLHNARLPDQGVSLLVTGAVAMFERAAAD